MIKRDEDGKIIAVDKLSSVTSELKNIEKKLSVAVKKKGQLTEDEDKELAKSASDMKELFALVSPSLQKGANPMELIGFLKQVAKMKELSEKLKEFKND